jgi:hypothetical protein
MNKEKEKYIRQQFVAKFAEELSAKDLYEYIVGIWGEKALAMKDGTPITYQDLTDFMQKEMEQSFSEKLRDLVEEYRKKDLRKMDRLLIAGIELWKGRPIKYDYEQ